MTDSDDEAFRTERLLRTRASLPLEFCVYKVGKPSYVLFILKKTPSSPDWFISLAKYSKQKKYQHIKCEYKEPAENKYRWAGSLDSYFSFELNLSRHDGTMLAGEYLAGPLGLLERQHIVEADLTTVVDYYQEGTLRDLPVEVIGGTYVGRVGTVVHRQGATEGFNRVKVAFTDTTYKEEKDIYTFNLRKRATPLEGAQQVLKPPDNAMDVLASHLEDLQLGIKNTEATEYDNLPNGNEIARMAIAVRAHVNRQRAANGVAPAPTPASAAHWWQNNADFCQAVNNGFYPRKKIGWKIS